MIDMFIEVKAQDFELTDAMKTYAEEKFGMLEKYDDQIIEIRCDLKSESHKHQNGSVYVCTGHLFVPGKDFFIEKTEEDLYKAIDKVKDHLQESLVEWKQKKREDEGSPM
jgi:putative sigma-54 modulation protein